MSIKNMNVKDLLKGCTIGRIQSVGYMQMIPLISDLVDDSIAPPDFLVSTQNYGHLIVENPDPTHKSILPFGAAFISSQAAQNHAAPKAAILNAKSKTSVPRAVCIQSTQGGIMRHGNHPLTILPWSLREPAMALKDGTSYDRMWAPIEKFNRELGASTRGHLEDYLNRFEKELDTFVAEFEMVPKQVGAIVLINGYVMGIERCPNYAYWSRLWTPLIREAYGSRILELIKQKEPISPKTRVPLDTAKIKNIKDVRAALNAAQATEDKLTTDVVKNFISKRFNKTVEETKGSLVVESLTHEQFTGQIVHSNDHVIYASLVTTGSWVDGQEWRESEEFKI